MFDLFVFNDHIRLFPENDIPFRCQEDGSPCLLHLYWAKVFRGKLLERSTLSGELPEELQVPPVYRQPGLDSQQHNLQGELLQTAPARLDRWPG